MKLIAGIFLLIFFIIFSPGDSYCGDKPSLKPVIVTASRLYSDNPFEISRSIDDDPTLDLDNSLIDSRTRGPKGIQNDISVRGATFEETMVLLDGLRLNDPQTGHFNLDIPLTRLDIERANIVYGPPTASYGSSGIGGAVNIISEPLKDKIGFEADMAGGQYDYYSGAASLDLPFKELKNRASFEGSRSGGYMAETEFDKIITNVSSKLEYENFYLDFMFGYMRKNFGADSFYSDQYNNEEEHTDTRLFKFGGGLEYKGVNFRPIFYWRRHWDNFILDRNRRDDGHKAFHKNYLYGFELAVSMDTVLGPVSYGFDISREKIDSTSLGGHARDKYALFLEDRMDFDKWFIDISARLDRYSSFGWEFNPGAGVGIFITPEFKLRASLGRAFRAPSFTDLYYVTAANVGNPDLSPEKSWSFDIGCDYKTEGLALSGTSFVRFTGDIIDWTRTGSSKVWNAKNIGEFDVYGFEAIFKADPSRFRIPKIKKVEIRYGYTEAFKKESVVSKYVLNYLMQNLIIDFEYELIMGIMNKWDFALKKRVGEEHYFLLDTEVYKDVRMGRFDTRIYFEAENITGADYTENGSVRQPGLWITGGVKLRF